MIMCESVCSFVQIYVYVYGSMLLSDQAMS